MTKTKIKNNYGWDMKITGIEKLDNETIEQLKNHNDTIFFNDTTGMHFMFTFKVNGHWFDVENIDMCEKSLEYILVD